MNNNSYDIVNVIVYSFYIDGLAVVIRNILTI